MGGLADLLAGAGQIYGGYSEAEAQAQRARQAKIAEEMAALELAGRKRLADYDAKVSGGLADFLPGGGRATTVQTPGEGAVIPATPVDDEGNAMPMDMGKAKPVQTENRLGALEFMHRAALEAGLPDKADSIQKRMRAFRNEGLEDTAKAITAGASDDEIRDAFNRQGSVKFSRVQRLPGSNKVIGITQDGRATTFDADAMDEALLDSKTRLSMRDKREERDYKRGRDDEDQARRATETGAKVDYYKALAERQRRPQGQKPVKPPDPAKERAERSRFDSAVTRYATEYATTEHPEEKGKFVSDKVRARKIAAIAGALADSDESFLGSPREAAAEASRRLDDLEKRAGINAAEDWSRMEEGSGLPPGEFSKRAGLSSVGGKEKWVADRAAKIVADAISGARAQRPMSPPAQGATRIKNNDEWAALPKGAHYIGPDGVLRRKS